MNSSSDQTKTDPAVPQTPSVTAAPVVISSPVIPAVSVFSSTTAPPVNPPKSPPPFALHSDKPLSKSPKFPLVVTALFIIVAAAGFGGSFFYYGVLGKGTKKTTASLPRVNPPPVAISTPVPPTNIFVTPSVSFRNLFSADVFASDNPFDETANPFTGVTGSSNPDTNAYQNPFDGQP